MTLVKAQLVPQEGGGSTITFLYNPSAISFTRTVEWKENKGSVGNNDTLPSTDYKGVKPYQVTIENMLIDTYESRSSCQSYIDALKDAVSPKQVSDATAGADGAADGGLLNRKRPLVYMFTMGSNIQLRCVVTTLTYNYTMFLPNGDPVRAMITLKLQEVDDIAAGSQGDNAGAANRQTDSRSARTPTG
ncbi:hypothetical protein [Gloeobacter violaceus]|uniref:Gll0426 protein n=1 Tax=Gloeobacter violaceus (strain ATCC 29082 / PCC 7421) TaxID=251221 RepID=Q7NNI5_GLOVI|nr:hypothetical protein [Gloeobacter violaceus]BAC88367.1 gll0426 [Gloeobacter violaceus PCC 7421]